MCRAECAPRLKCEPACSGLLVSSLPAFGVRHRPALGCVRARVAGAFVGASAGAVAPTRLGARGTVLAGASPPARRVRESVWV